MIFNAELVQTCRQEMKLVLVAAPGKTLPTLEEITKLLEESLEPHIGINIGEHHA